MIEKFFDLYVKNPPEKYALEVSEKNIKKLEKNPYIDIVQVLYRKEKDKTIFDGILVVMDNNIPKKIMSGDFLYMDNLNNLAVLHSDKFNYSLKKK